MSNAAVDLITTNFEETRRHARWAEEYESEQLSDPNCFDIPDHIFDLRNAYHLRVAEGVLISVFREPHASEGNGVDLLPAELIELATSRLFDSDVIRQQYVRGYADTMKERGKFDHDIVLDIAICCRMIRKEFDRVKQQLLQPSARKNFRNTARENLRKFRASGAGIDLS